MDALSLFRMVRPDAALSAYLPAGIQLPPSKTLAPKDLEQLQPAAAPLPSPVARPAETSFADTLSRLVDEVGHKQQAGAAAVNGLLSGQNVPLHQAVIAMEEASVSFQLMVEVRNKLLESYQELMRMQV